MKKPAPWDKDVQCIAIGLAAVLFGIWMGWL